MRLSKVLGAIHVHKMASEFKPKRPRLGYNNKSDKSYFESYADITVHEEMLADNVRTNAYRNAIFNCMPSMANKVVLDVGAGTGILSCFCAQAGASKVYAVEASSIAEQAKQVVKANGLDDKVIVLESLMEEIELPEKVDVIVSEWMGYCLLYESMLGSVITARDRWLKPGGLMLPSSAQMYLSPISDDEIVIEKVNFWLDMVDSYGVDMSALQSFARKSFSKDVMVKQITCENILANPQMIANLDLCTVTHQDNSHVQHCFTFSSFGMADLQGFALWFDVKFPLRKQPVLDHEVQDTNQEDYIIPANNIEQKYEPGYSHHIETSLSSNSTNCSAEPSNLTLSTSPYKPETHWKQSILYLQQEKPVSQDSKISGNLVLKHSEENHRFLDISLSCVVDEKPVTPQNYFMGYELPKNTKENKTV